jgi:hypothetical protein
LLEQTGVNRSSQEVDEVGSGAAIGAVTVLDLRRSWPAASSRRVFGCSTFATR